MNTILRIDTIESWTLWIGADGFTVPA